MAPVKPHARSAPARKAGIVAKQKLTEVSKVGRKKNPAVPKPKARPEATLNALPDEILLNILNEIHPEKHLYQIENAGIYLVNHRIHDAAMDEIPPTNRFFVRIDGWGKRHHDLERFLQGNDLGRGPHRLADRFAKITSLRVIQHVGKTETTEAHVQYALHVHQKLKEACIPMGVIHWEKTEARFYKQYEKSLT
ncbi:unnamed protein product [Zymoseptoria tritici ST99CH_1A5]|uniref:F-box domain-containing protein n=2 Tax=Zymoseptoria tritici TaxID=1047171 RepID=F9WYT9_ZYMTI|nr:uncharacterized protein MYCGRDRAFT_88777 [Zymoseptoria tritici IPO323]EGP92687.1 hypothetical protein MYCGRDRAFT_88777 [Zymoseptoria tritici IPO323]SMY18797.1 unnamed protein product [Zymoseptoria tritici ST99CH_1A5]